MTKVIENSNCRTELAVTANMEQGKKNSTDLWKKHGCFGSQACDFSIEEANLPENTIFYINQGYLSYKDNKKIYYNDIFIIGQIIPLLNQPEDICEYVPKEDEVKILRARYNTSTGAFLGLEYSIGYLTVRNDPQEQLFDYGYAKDNSKILYSTHKMKIPNSSAPPFLANIGFSTNQEHLAKLIFQTPSFFTIYCRPN